MGIRAPTSARRSARTDGNSAPPLHPYQAYRTADGYVTIGANTDRLWLRLVNDVLKRPDWADDPRFVD